VEDLIVSNDGQISKPGIEKTLRFKLIFGPVVASPVNQNRSGLSDRNPLQSFARFDAVDLSLKSELVVLRLDNRGHEVWMRNIIVVVLFRLPKCKAGAFQFHDVCPAVIGFDQQVGYVADINPPRVENLNAVGAKYPGIVFKPRLEFMLISILA